MAEQNPQRHDRLTNPSVRYERSDVNVRWVLIVLVFVLAIGIVIEVAISGFFHGFRDHQDQVKQSEYPLAPGPSQTTLPREPRLEQVDRLSGSELSTARNREANEQETLNGYGSAPQNGFVHIPIDRAMQILLERKTLKSRPEPAAGERKRSEGLIDAGEPNSGRLFKGESK